MKKQKLGKRKRNASFFFAVVGVNDRSSEFRALSNFFWVKSTNSIRDFFRRAILKEKRQANQLVPGQEYKIIGWEAQKKLTAGSNITISEDNVITADLSGCVEKEAGKGLSSNDYTNAAKTKVDAIPTNPKYTDTTYTLGDGLKFEGNKIVIDVDALKTLLGI